jgi:hypothetical protein
VRGDLAPDPAVGAGAMWGCRGSSQSCRGAG